MSKEAKGPISLCANIADMCVPFQIVSESELFTGDTSKDNHSSGPVIRELVPSPHKRSKLSN